jgi:hypothetical protein
MSADPPHRLAGPALLHLTATAELDHQTLHGFLRLGNQQNGVEIRFYRWSVSSSDSAYFAQGHQQE